MHESERARKTWGCLGRALAAVACAQCIVSSAAAMCTAINGSGGLVHIDPRSSSGPLVVREIGGQSVDIPFPDSGFRAKSANALLLTLDCVRGEQLKFRLALGWPPPKHNLEGTGALAGYGVIGDGQQLSPAVLAIWTFGSQQQAVRPFVGAGLNYTWFRHSRITNEAFRQQTFGPNAVTSVDLTRSWNPVATVGLAFSLPSGFSLEGAATYAPLKSRVTVTADNTAFGATVRSTTELKNRTVAASLTLGYSWGR